MNFSRRMCLCTLPEGVRGKSFINTQCFGVLYGARCWRQKAKSRSTVGEQPDAGRRNAVITGIELTRAAITFRSDIAENPPALHDR
jgi:hypothetical protein